MKISVMTNGMIKVEGSTLAEEVEMRNKLQAQGKSCTPIEYEGSVQDCLDWIMGKSESELDEVKDEVDNGSYVLTDENEEELEIEIDDVIDYIDENCYDLGVDDIGLDEVGEAVENYLWNRPEVTEKDFYYLVESGQVEELAEKVYNCL